MPGQPPLCTNCGQGRLVELEMTVKSGEVLTMTSCQRCETRTWAADGRPVDREELLRITSGNPDFTPTPSERTTRRSKARG